MRERKLYLNLCCLKRRSPRGKRPGQSEVFTHKNTSITHPDTSVNLFHHKNRHEIRAAEISVYQITNLLMCEHIILATPKDKILVKDPEEVPISYKFETRLICSLTLFLRHSVASR
ncbi:hypothetical protein Q8A67_001305 [Cirrhinus molitorella]|uniref:Uncharacterized protein n=1 Tax=Cirrhinus molitorella TaxID=172907 RepID=A0AA88U7H4_9TELE|nr:hypothetical protein Q8A67_001305 [Cirrhinus molitorella]